MEEEDAPEAEFFLDVRPELRGAAAAEDEEGATWGGSIRYRCGEPGAERLSMALECGLGNWGVDPPNEEDEPFLSLDG